MSNVAFCGALIFYGMGGSAIGWAVYLLTGNQNVAFWLGFGVAVIFEGLTIAISGSVKKN